MSNYQTLFHVIDLKLDIEPSLTSHLHAASNEVATLHMSCAQLVEGSDEYLCISGTYHSNIVV